MRRLDLRTERSAPSPQREKATLFSHLVPVPVSSAKTEKRILVINGHPDPRPERYCAALARAYLQGAHKSGWEAREIAIGAITRSEHPALKDALEAMRWSNALAIVFPLWLDAPPAPLTDFLALTAQEQLGAKPARLIVTMEMPAFAHRREFRADGPHRISLPGIAGEPTFIGSVDAISAAQRADWLSRLAAFGEAGS